MTGKAKRRVRDAQEQEERMRKNESRRLRETPLRILQEFSMEHPEVEATYLHVTISRMPDGSGVIDRVERSMGACRIDVTDMITDVTRGEIELEAAKLWDAYWTADPRCAVNWTRWRRKKGGKKA